MKTGLLTERQIEVLRCRRQGLTQQQIGDTMGCSKANVCTLEKSAMENVRRAHETLQFMYSLDGQFLCVIPIGTDLLAVPEQVFREADERGVKVRHDTIDLINRLLETAPQHIQARYVMGEVRVYLSDDGEVYFE